MLLKICHIFVKYKGTQYETLRYAEINSFQVRLSYIKLDEMSSLTEIVEHPFQEAFGESHYMYLGKN